MLNYKKHTYLLKTRFSCNNPIIIQEIFREKGTELNTTRVARKGKFSHTPKPESINELGPHRNYII